MFKWIEDAKAVLERDPAAGSLAEVLLCSPGVKALAMHRVAHGLWSRGLRIPARMLSQFSRFLTGIEIHPGARLGRRIVIDHGMGVVIGETAIVGNDVTMFHGVTLGGVSMSKGKRHPTVEDGALLGAGSSVLGPVVIGTGAKVGAGAVVMSSVPAGWVAVGMPAKSFDPMERKAAKPVLN